MLAYSVVLDVIRLLETRDTMMGFNELHGDLLAPSFALSPFTCAVNICHQSILFDFQALEIVICHLCNSDGPAC
jgi:hypothetical protein